jgi:hypothetical protein
VAVVASSPVPVKLLCYLVIKESRMYFLKEPIGSLIFLSGYGNTYDAVLAKLREMHFEVKIQNRERGEIVISCLTSLINMLLWRCWADKLLFEVKQIDEDKTKVDIFGLPNLFRIKVKEGEAITSIEEITSRLKECIV